MQTDDKLVAVYSASSELLALSVRDLLIEADIPALLNDGALGSFGSGSGYFLPSSYRAEVLVREGDREKAEELIAGFQGTLGMLEEADVVEEDE